MNKSKLDEFLNDRDISVAMGVARRLALQLLAGTLVLYLSYLSSDYQYIGYYLAESYGLPNGAAYYASMLVFAISILLIGIGVTLILPRLQFIIPFVVLFVMIMALANYKDQYLMHPSYYDRVATNPAFSKTWIVNWYAAFRSEDPHQQGMPRLMEKSDQMGEVLLEKTDELKKLFLK